MIKHFANRCDAIITPTSTTKEYLRNLGVSALIETIPTGISIKDCKRYSPQQIRDLRSQYAAPNERLLISVSRMAKEKNLDFLIDGLVKIKDRTRTPFKCLLIGDGAEKRRLENRVAELGMDDQIIFSAIWPQVKLFSVTVVKDGYNGFKLAESTDNWAETVTTLLEDDRQLSTLSENSRAFAENYSVEKITEKVSKLYRLVVVINQSKSG